VRKCQSQPEGDCNGTKLTSIINSHPLHPITFFRITVLPESHGSVPPLPRLIIGPTHIRQMG
jgi:hypothetical protein